MTSSLSGPLSDDSDQEINVDSGHEEGDDDDSCGGVSGGGMDTAGAALPFSISRLLAEPTVQRHSPQGLLYNSAAGVIRVPAHRPPPLAAAPAFPWLALDPAILHRSAAAAFASQVVKERLTGQSYKPHYRHTSGL